MSSIKKAIDYLLTRLEKTSDGNLFTSTTDKRKQPYPEVTGYLIPTMLNLGFKDEAYKMAKWLSTCQKENGSWDNYVFDTGMVLQGLKNWKEFDVNIEKGKNFIRENYSKDEYTHPEVSKDINLLAMNTNKISDDFLVCGKSYQMQGMMLHFWAYILEAFIYNGLNEYNVADIEHISMFQKIDGSIPAIYGQEWICYPAIAQMACLFYKCGFKNAGDKAIKYLESVQNEDGSFYGSNGEYFKDEKVLWATKYFIDAYLLKIKADFEARIDEFPTEIYENDDRLIELLNHVGDFKDKQILDAGCGRGRFLKYLSKNKCNFSDLFCVDIMGKFELFDYKEGSVLNIPYDDNKFDVVYCVEVLEHSILPENAIREMSRVLKQGGKLIIIDKNANIQGGKEEWEQWFTQTGISNIMVKYFKEVKSKYFGINNMWLIWEGSK